MRDGAELAAVLETVGRMFGYSLVAGAAVAALAGLFILLFRIPARATLVASGRERREKDLRASIILNGVYTNGIWDGSYKVEDVVQFTTREGEEVRISARRGLFGDPVGLVWYSPSNPRRVTTKSPLACFAVAGAFLATAAALSW